MKNFFYYHHDVLHVEDVPLTTIAQEISTPCYIYSRAALEENWHAFHDALRDIPHQICYAVKANSNLAILQLLANQGSGFDIVSIGELERVLAAGGDPKKIIFSGVGKTEIEIARALDVGIGCFNIESESEIVRIHDIAQQKNKIAPVSLRVNPNIDAKTHPYIATGLHENKFGIELSQVLPLCQEIKKRPYLALKGIGFHIGSQLMELTPFLEAIDCILDVAQSLEHKGITLDHIDIGGGLGINYGKENPPTIAEYVSAIHSRLSHLPLTLLLEPGRALVGNTGILLTRVEYIKSTAHKHFAIVDAGMNDLLRPALYEAWQEIVPVQLRQDVQKKYYDVVGPVCESADFLGKDRELAIQHGDLLAILSAGAYGFVMSSNYNSRPRAAEVIVDKDKIYVVRQRETIASLFAEENLIKGL